MNANGLGYGALVNARKRYPRLRVVAVKAPLDILCARLEVQGRETVAEIKARLERAAAIQALGDDIIRFNNDCPLEKSIEAFVALISD